MVHKYFPLDKNYILEQAQLDLQKELIVHTIDFAKNFYHQVHNPLGLEDDTTNKINAHTTVYTHRLDEFYRNLSGIYRYKFGHNQLEFLFDGQDHYKKYQEDWKNAYDQWLMDFCYRPNFLKAILELTVFYPEGRKAELAENRMKAFIHQHFELKVYKYRGIVKMRIA